MVTLPAPHLYAAYDPQTRRVLGDDDLGHAPVVGATSLRAAHDDQKVGTKSVRGEPLVPVDYPLVTIFAGRGLDRAWIRPRGVWFSHREPRLHLPFGQRDQPFALLLVGPVLEQDLLVSRVGRDHAEQRRRPHAVGEHLIHIRVLQEIETGATVLGRQMGRPKARLFYFLLDRLAQRPRFAALLIGGAIAVAGPELALVGQDVAVDDLCGQRANFIDAGFERRDWLYVHLHDGFLCEVKRSAAP